MTTKIEWTDLTLNPVVGCLNGCTYCYARRMAARNMTGCDLCRKFIPHPHLERLDKLNARQKPKRIFIDSMWDPFGPGVKPEWVQAVIDKMRECPQHTFQILTKRPEGYAQFEWPKNVWHGATIESHKAYDRVEKLIKSSNNLRFLSLEPLLGRIYLDDTCSSSWCWRADIDWVIVGPQTGPGRINCAPEWIHTVVVDCYTEIVPCFVKAYAFHDGRISKDMTEWPEWARVRQFPKEAP